MRSLLDQIIDRIDEGTDMIVVWQPPPCENPQMDGVVSFRHGCRCRRCDDAAHASSYLNDRRRYTQQSQWRTP